MKSTKPVFTEHRTVSNEKSCPQKQDRVAIDIIIALQEGTCVIIQIECCVFKPDGSANESFLLPHIKTQVHVLSDMTPSLGT